MVVMTSGSMTELTDAHRALASLAVSRRDLQPLRTYLRKLTAITQAMLKALIPGTSLRSPRLRWKCLQRNPGQETSMS